MNILENISLRDKTTFGVDVSARHYLEVNKKENLEELISSNIYKTEKHFILGGGSNTLFVKDYDGLIITPNFKGIEVVDENKQTITLKIRAGENWGDLINYTLENNYGGIENLIMIPGKVGASPVQNISAYGGGISDVLIEAETFNLETGKSKTLSKEDCKFGYRESIFKTPEYKNVLITSITIKLTKSGYHKIETTYESRHQNIKGKLEELGKPPYTIQDVAEAIKDMRSSKLPKVGEIGSAGSTFKNPIITEEQAEKLKKQYPEVPMFPEGELFKIPAGWILEELGWKGKKIGDTGTWENHALIVCNYGNATGKEIYEIIRTIQKEFEQATGIRLETEINIIN